jgi:osmoprotectant transport system permease protein
VQKLNFKKIRACTYVLPVLLMLLYRFTLSHQNTAGKLTAGFTPEFMGRQDGDLGLESKYGLKIHTVVISDAVMYKAAFEKAA